MSIRDLFGMKKARAPVEDVPIEVDSQWNPGTKLKLMSYNEALACLKSGVPAKMAQAIGQNILNAPIRYNDISKSLHSPPNESLTDLLLALLKHDDYHVRCCIPSVLEAIGDLSFLPYLEDVIKHDQDSQVVKNARIAVEKIKSLGATTDSVKFLRRYTKPIDRTTTGTYEEYSAPNKIIARAFLDRTGVTKEYFYIEVITPEGNVGKDKTSMY
jgi:hypothetical protein